MDPSICCDTRILMNTLTTQLFTHMIPKQSVTIAPHHSNYFVSWVIIQVIHCSLVTNPPIWSKPFDIENSKNTEAKQYNLWLNKKPGKQPPAELKLDHITLYYCQEIKICQADTSSLACVTLTNHKPNSMTSISLTSMMIKNKNSMISFMLWRTTSYS